MHTLVKDLISKLDEKMTPKTIGMMETALGCLTGLSCFVLLSDLAKGDSTQRLNLALTFAGTISGFIATKVAHEYKTDKIANANFFQPAARSEILADLFSTMISPQN